MATLPRLPQKSDFPPSLTLDIIPPSSSSSSSSSTSSSSSAINILILLHGLGDTNLSFNKLAQNLHLPETAYLTIQGPHPLPSFFTGSEAPSFHWGDDILFDEQKGEIALDAGFSKTTAVLLESVVLKVLVQKCGYQPRNVLFLGYGQGGMAALALAVSAAAGEGKLEFGGVVSVGGKLPSEALSLAASSRSSSGGGKEVGKCRTPVLVLGGSRSSEVTRSAVDGLKEAFVDVEYVKWAKGEDSMPKSREEMLPIMRFFARRLRSRAGVMEGAVEIG